MFNVYKNSFKEGFVVVVVLHSSQLPEQKEGLFFQALTGQGLVDLSSYR